LQGFVRSSKGYLAARYLTNQDAHDALIRSTPNNKLSQFDNLEGWPLEVLLCFFEEASCTDPRDRIYALQNMSSGPVIPVDYAMEFTDLYWEVLWRCNSCDTKFSRILSEALGVPDSGSLVLRSVNRPGTFTISPFRRHRRLIEAEKRGGGGEA
jgi:hypothetical protein